MANECLVTKLKGVVNNPKLPFLDELIIKGIYDSSMIRFIGNQGYDYNTTNVRVISGSPTVGGNSLTDGSTPTEEIMLGQTGMIGVRDKTKIVNIIEMNLPNGFEQYMGCTGLKFLSSSRYGSIAPLSNLTLKRFDYAKKITDLFIGLAGSIGSLEELRCYAGLEIAGEEQQYFAVNQLAKFSAIKYFGAENITLPFSIEDYVHACRALGRTSSTQQIGFYAKNIEFNGAILSTGNLDVKITWTPTTITCNNVTINA